MTYQVEVTCARTGTTWTYCGVAEVPEPINGILTVVDEDLTVGKFTVANLTSVECSREPEPKPWSPPEAKKGWWPW